MAGSCEAMIRRWYRMACNQFGRTPDNDVEMNYVRQLSRYSEADLQEAFRLSARTDKYMPAIPDLIEALTAVQRNGDRPEQRAEWKHTQRTIVARMTSGMDVYWKGGGRPTVEQMVMAWETDRDRCWTGTACYATEHPFPELWARDDMGVEYIQNTLTVGYLDGKAHNYHAEPSQAGAEACERGRRNLPVRSGVGGEG